MKRIILSSINSKILFESSSKTIPFEGKKLNINFINSPVTKEDNELVRQLVKRISDYYKFLINSKRIIDIAKEFENKKYITSFKLYRLAIFGKGIAEVQYSNDIDREHIYSVNTKNLNPISISRNG